MRLGFFLKCFRKLRFFILNIKRIKGIKMDAHYWCIALNFLISLNVKLI